MSDIFVSYSRRDADFVRRLDDVLKQQGRDVWVDWEDIPVTSTWWHEIRSGIEAADTFVFIITQNSLESPVCHLELAHARANNKRIIPVIRQMPNEKAAFGVLAGIGLSEIVQGMFTGRDPLIVARDNWRALAERNWLFFDNDDSFDHSLANLLGVLSTDLERVRLHTRLLIRAREWDVRGRDPSFLLQGTELEEAQQFLALSASKEPAPLPLQGEYILASQQRAAERARHERNLNQRARRRLYLLIGVGVLIILALNIASSQLLDLTYDTLQQTSKSVMRSALLVTAAGIDGDEFRGLVQEAQPRADGLTDDPRYWNQVEWLQKTQAIFPGWEPYTVHLLDSPEFEYIADVVTTQTPASKVDFRQKEDSRYLFELQEEMQRTHEPILGDIEPNPEINEPELISGYTPIFDANEEIVGLLGAVMELPVETYRLFSQIQVLMLILNVFDSFLITATVIGIFLWIVLRLGKFVWRRRRRL